MNSTQTTKTALAQGAKSHLAHGSTLSNIVIRNLSKPDIDLLAPQSQSAKSHSAHNLNYGNFVVNACTKDLMPVTTRGVAEFSDTLGVEFLHMLGTEFLESIKKSLPVLAGGCYGSPAAPQWVAGRENLRILKATYDAPSVFFYVVATAHLFNRILSMVALVGQRSRWLVSFSTSILTPANVTTHSERENSGGDSLIKLKETINMATPTQTHPKFLWRFMALSRADMNAKPCRLSVEATSEKEARKILAPNFILSFAARLPVPGVAV